MRKDYMPRCAFPLALCFCGGTLSTASRTYREPTRGNDMSINILATIAAAATYAAMRSEGRSFALAFAVIAAAAMIVIGA